MKSIESLARVDVLCVDKTGTITNNTMKVLDIFDKNGNSLIDKKEDLKILARYINTIEDKNITIDAIKEQLYGISTEKLSNIEKENFNSKNKFSFIKIDENVTYKLGAPEILLNKEYEELVNKRTKNGERLIAFVELKNDETIPILFISLKNEIRKNAKEIFEFFDNRNVQIRVISGDNPITVSSIAKQAGIKGYEKYIDCRELKNYADIQKAVKKYIVFGRVNPEQKRQIIKALKEQGLKVAMTGDGVNDSPALKTADIGCAMGKVGTEVAKEAADVILTDDNFATIVSAVEEGRRIYDNILKVIQFLLSCNVGEVIVLLLATLFAPQIGQWFGISDITMIQVLLPIHILWINLVTDTFPALALAFDPANKDIMDRKPVKRNEGIFTKGRTFRIIYQGLMIGLLTLSAYLIGLGTTHTAIDGLTLEQTKIEVGQTMAFIVLAFSELIHVFNIRDNKNSIFKTGILGNGVLILAILASALLMVVILFIPQLRTIFSIPILPSDNIIETIVLVLSPIVIVEIMKLFKVNTTRDE